MADHRSPVQGGGGEGSHDDIDDVQVQQSDCSDVLKIFDDVASTEGKGCRTVIS